MVECVLDYFFVFCFIVLVFLYVFVEVVEWVEVYEEFFWFDYGCGIDVYVCFVVVVFVGVCVVFFVIIGCIYDKCWGVKVCGGVVYEFFDFDVVLDGCV